MQSFGNAPVHNHINTFNIFGITAKVNKTLRHRLKGSVVGFCRVSYHHHDAILRTMSKNGVLRQILVLRLAKYFVSKATPTALGQLKSIEAYLIRTQGL